MSYLCTIFIKNLVIKTEVKASILYCGSYLRYATLTFAQILINLKTSILKTPKRIALTLAGYPPRLYEMQKVPKNTAPKF